MPDYAFYIAEYKGDSISGADFSRLAKLASDQLEHYKRIYTVTAPDDKAEAMAVCAIADALYYYENAQSGAGGAVSSASIGSVSVSYGGISVDVTPKAQAQELYRCAQRYLNICRGCV